MKRTVPTLAFLLTAFVATPASAQGLKKFLSGLTSYGGIEGGLWKPELSNFNNGNRAVSYNEGTDLGVFFGTDFGPIRLESEYFFLSASHDQLQYNSNAGNLQYLDYDGRTRVRTLISSLLLEAGNDAMTGYIGLGMGSSSIRTSGAASYAPDGYLLDFSDKVKAPAKQFVAGVEKSLAPNIMAGVRYRYLWTKDFSLANNENEFFNGKLKSSSFLATLAYRMGGRPVVAAPVVAEEVIVEKEEVATRNCPDGSIVLATEECPVAVVETGPFMVFFDWDQSDITAEAAATLDEAAAAYAAGGQASVMLAGHADRSGGDAYNVALSQRRADAVAAYLGGKGVPADAMSETALGESQNLVPTEDGVREPQNRRVEITFGPGAGQ